MRFICILSIKSNSDCNFKVSFYGHNHKWHFIMENDYMINTIEREKWNKGWIFFISFILLFLLKCHYDPKNIFFYRPPHTHTLVCWTIYIEEEKQSQTLSIIEHLSSAFFSLLILLRNRMEVKQNGAIWME